MTTYKELKRDVKYWMINCLTLKKLSVPDSTPERIAENRRNLLPSYSEIARLRDEVLDSNDFSSESKDKIDNVFNLIDDYFHYFDKGYKTKYNEKYEIIDIEVLSTECETQLNLVIKELE